MRGFVLKEPLLNNCIHCGNKIPESRRSPRWKVKYCSNYCIKASWRERNLKQHNNTNKKWREKNPDYFKEYGEKHRKEPTILDHKMLGKSAVKKGREFENWVASKLREVGLDVNARRTFGSGGGHEKGDIYNSLGLNIECKNTKTLSFKSAWKQCNRDADMSRAKPVLIWHPPNTPFDGSIVFITVEHLAELLSGIHEARPLEDPKIKYPLMRLKNAINEVLKNLPKQNK